ncbi:hypothetical protein FRB90_007740 [Tulasnella sp. 427]|nr:hypothetical protein FRB90_007740 [Tulasnella sp. 427]
MLSRNLIPSLLLLATSVIADQALEVRDVTTLVVEAIPGGPATAMTTFLREEPTTSTTLGDGWCWCPGPETTPAPHVETRTIRAPTYTVTTVTLTPGATQTATVCRWPGEPNQQRYRSADPAGNNILLNMNAGVKGTSSKHLAAIAALCGVGVGAGFLFL